MPDSVEYPPPEPGASDQPASALFPWSLVPEPDAGEKHQNYFSWHDTVLHGLNWPYYAIRGRRPGRSVAIVAGMHGGSARGVLGALRLAGLLDPERVQGSLLVLPIVNLPAFRERSALVTPQDGRDLDCVFPGSVAGTFSEVLAVRLLQDIAGPADAIVDLRGADLIESLASHTRWYVTGEPEIDQVTREMADAFDLPFAVQSPVSDAARSLTAHAALLGKASLRVDAGGDGPANDEDILAVYQGLVNVLRVLGNLTGLRTPSVTRSMEPGERFIAPADGLWMPRVRAGQELSTDEVLGILSDTLGHEFTRFTAESAGVVLRHLSVLSARKGDLLVEIAREPGMNQ